jgi:hypothetical protein
MWRGISRAPRGRARLWRKYNQNMVNILRRHDENTATLQEHHELTARIGRRYEEDTMRILGHRQHTST